MVVAVHRRQLPIVGPCDGFVPAPGSHGDGGFCERCCKQVHDVSAMRESELHDFLEVNAGTQVCLAYRVDTRGYLQLRPEPRFASMGVGVLALLLAACAGHLSEAEAPGSTCHDADGYEVACPSWPDADMHSVPDERASWADHDDADAEAGEGCPVRPTADAPEPRFDDATDEASARANADETDGPDELVGPDDASPEAPSTIATFRANFSLDPDASMMRGAVVVGWSSLSSRTGRLRYAPTAQLWDDWQRRRAQRRLARERSRDHRRAVSQR